MHICTPQHLRVFKGPSDDLSRKRLADILRWNGIPTNRERPSTPKRTFRFVIGGLKAVCGWELKQKVRHHTPVLLHHGKMNAYSCQWIRVRRKSREWNRAKQLAIYILYTLGYDIGIVDISVFHRSPKYVLSRIREEATPGSKEKQQLYKNGLPQSDTGQSTREIWLGTDIEFVLRTSNGKFVPASKFLNRHGNIGYDAIRMKKKKHCYPIGELRPSARKHPRDLVAGIFECMHEAAQKIHPHIQWLAGGHPLYGYPIGGHIHFNGVPLSTSFIRALDYYVTLPLFLLESDESRSRRPKYGTVGDVRKKFHGGFEYRTPPSWIVSPTIAAGILSIAYVVAHDYLTLPSKQAFHYRLYNAFYSGDKEYVRKIVERLRYELMESPTYRLVQSELHAFWKLIDAGFQWNELEDIRSAWGISVP